MAKEIVEIRNLSASYGNRMVLEDINLTIYENDFVGIIGPNGGGKTTLLKILLGIIKPLKGEVRIFGEKPEKVLDKIGYVPQFSKYDLDFPISVMDVVLMGRMNTPAGRGKDREKDRIAAEEALNDVKLSDNVDRPIGKLSYGQRQRVFIARALARNPELLLLDEPTASVDPALQADFYEILRDLKKRMAIILVTHDIAVISKYIEKVGCLNRKFYYHESKEISEKDLQAVYGCPVEMIAHGVPHRVMKEHNKK